MMAAHGCLGLREERRIIALGMKRFFRNNGLSLVVGFLFLLLLLGQTFTGFHEYNSEREEHGQAPVRLLDYLCAGHFIESVCENWESEFLQMAAYVILTAKLYQVGSAESKDPSKKEEVDGDPRRHRNEKDVPFPVFKGGLLLKLYEHSLSLALAVLFLISFAGHIYGGSKMYNEQRLLHGQPAASWLEYAGSSQFWFESFQNWQSEFLAVLSIVVLSIWLREKGSPESKPVASKHSDTGL
jgi:hypothetical protein